MSSFRPSFLYLIFFDGLKNILSPVALGFGSHTH